MGRFGNNECLIDDSVSYLGNPLIILENRHVRLSIMPEYGAKIFEFIYKPSNHNFLWENPRIKGRKAYYGANYDNFVTGGMEDAFPTVLPSNHIGEEIPFFGEVWSVPWKYEIICSSPGSVSVKFECCCAIYPVKIEKIITLHKDDTTACIKYKIINLSYLELDYILGIHPSIAIDDNCSINLPDSFYNINVLQSGEMPENFKKDKAERFKWPLLRGVDLTKIMEEKRNFVLDIYSDPLKEGWIRVFNEAKAIGFGMNFNPGIFKVLSTWFIYGGWRGHYCIMAEALTSWPMALHKAVENGSAARLKPKETVETEVKMFILPNY